MIKARHRLSLQRKSKQNQQQEIYNSRYYSHFSNFEVYVRTKVIHKDDKRV